MIRTRLPNSPGLPAKKLARVLEERTGHERGCILGSFWKHGFNRSLLSILQNWRVFFRLVFNLRRIREEKLWRRKVGQAFWKKAWAKISLKPFPKACQAHLQTENRCHRLRAPCWRPWPKFTLELSSWTYECSVIFGKLMKLGLYRCIFTVIKEWVGSAFLVIYEQVVQLGWYRGRRKLVTFVPLDMSQAFLFCRIINKFQKWSWALVMW